MDLGGALSIPAVLGISERGSEYLPGTCGLHIQHAHSLVPCKYRSSLFELHLFSARPSAASALPEAPHRFNLRFQLDLSFERDNTLSFSTRLLLICSRSFSNSFPFFFPVDFFSLFDPSTLLLLSSYCLGGPHYHAPRNPEPLLIRFALDLSAGDTLAWRLSSCGCACNFASLNKKKTRKLKTRRGSIGYCFGVFRSCVWNHPVHPLRKHLLPSRRALRAISNPFPPTSSIRYPSCSPWMVFVEDKRS